MDKLITFCWKSDSDEKWYISYERKRPGWRRPEYFFLDGPFDTRTEAEQERGKWTIQNGELVKRW